MSDTDDHSETCCFCLGSDVDIPPFGTISDAKDLISPCSTCSIVSHRKCLLDWFNSVPSDKLQIIYAHRKSSSTTTSISRSNTRGRGNNDNGNNDHDELGVGAPPINQETNININFSTRALSQFLASVTNSAVVADQLDSEINHNINANSIPGRYPESDSGSTSNSYQSSSYIAYILVPCPQCKQDIVFSMNRSSLLALQSSTKSLITTCVQYGGVFLGITSAMTGILSMGYIGLTTCGIKMMDCIVPSPILIRILTKKSSLHTHSSYQMLSKILFGDSGNGSSYPVDNLEQGLIQGLIDPFKFLRIPVLPIVMYRARTSSIFQCFFGKERLNSWITEGMILSYISSMSDHKLIRILIKNFSESVKHIIQNPWNLSNLNIFKGIDWTNSRNIISLLIPIRWIYDLFYRLTFNRKYFNLTMRIRPRAIANSLSSEEVDELEDLNNQVHELAKRHIKIYRTLSKKIDNDKKFKIPFLTTVYKNVLYFMKIKSSSFSYLKLKLLINLKYTLACLKHDYSHTFSHKSIIVKSLTTMLWPFLSSRLNSTIILPLLSSFTWLKFNELSLDKKILIGNIVGLVGFSIIKELINLYLVKLKVKQMANIQALNLQDAQIIKEVTSTILESTFTNDSAIGNSGSTIVVDLDNDDIASDDEIIINGNDNNDDNNEDDDDDAGAVEFGQVDRNIARLAAQLGLSALGDDSLFNDDFPGNFPG